MLEDSGVEVGSACAEADRRARVPGTLYRPAQTTIDEANTNRWQPAANISASSTAVAKSLWLPYDGVGGVHPCTHDRRLMADHVDTVEQRRQRPGVANVDPPHVSRQLCIGPVRRREHRIDRHHLMAGVDQRHGHTRSDESGCAGQQHPHGRSNGSSTPSCGRQCVHVDT
jgi:hypothetical protein